MNLHNQYLQSFNALEEWHREEIQVIHLSMQVHVRPILKMNDKKYLLSEVGVSLKGEQKYSLTEIIKSNI